MLSLQLAEFADDVVNAHSQTQSARGDPKGSSVSRSHSSSAQNTTTIAFDDITRVSNLDQEVSKKEEHLDEEFALPLDEDSASFMIVLEVFDFAAFIEDCQNDMEEFERMHLEFAQRCLR